MSDVIKIGKTLSQLLTEKGHTQASLAKATGVPRTTIAEWSSNRPPRNPVQAQVVAKHLGVSMHFLLFGEEDSQEPIQRLLKEDFFSGTFEINIKRVKVKNE